MMLPALAKRLWLCFALLTALPIVRAQKPSVIPLVPAANWRLASSQRLDLDAVRKWDGDPAIEREYGVKSLEHRTYQLDNKLAEAIVEEASDASSAYGLLTYYQKETMVPEKGMQLTMSGPDGALLARGRIFFRVLRPTGSQISDTDFSALLIVMGGTRPSAEAMANLPGALPATGLVPGSEKYLLGLEAARRVLPSFRTDLIGFAQGAEAEVATYVSGRDGKTRATVVAITYPTPQIARVRYGAMEEFLGINQTRGSEPLYGKRRGSFVFLVLNADSPATATKLLDELKVSEHVSWNERYPGDKSIALQLVRLILANLLFVFISVGFSVLGGILIVLFRTLARKWFPESVWGHPEDDVIITLKLR